MSRGPSNNVQRDGHYMGPYNDGTKVLWNVNAASASPIVMGCATDIYYDYGYVSASRAAVSISPNQFAAIGLYIEQPRYDRGLYRIHANLNAAGGIVVGYADATPGSPGNINNGEFIPFIGSFDAQLTIEPTPDGDTFENRALAIAVLLGDQVTGETRTGHLSVQNLGVKPPTMHNAVS